MGTSDKVEAGCCCSCGCDSGAAADADVEAKIAERVKLVIDEIRPLIQADGGDCVLIKVEDRVVYVQLTGACLGCPHSQATLKDGIEVRVRASVPEIVSVEMI